MSDPTVPTDLSGYIPDLKDDTFTVDLAIDLAAESCLPTPSEATFALMQAHRAWGMRYAPHLLKEDRPDA